MKFVLQFLAAAVSMSTILSACTSATPTKRAGITCTKTYGGAELHIASFGGKGAAAGIFELITKTNDGNNYLSTSSPVNDISYTFQFDTCQTVGWNVEGELYGQLKITDQSNTKCVTAIPATDQPDRWSLLQIQECESYNGGNLNNQWFKASPGYSSDFGGAYIQLELIGNPNDNDWKSAKPIVTSSDIPQGNDLVLVHPLDTPVSYFLVLYHYSER